MTGAGLELVYSLLALAALLPAALLPLRAAAPEGPARAPGGAFWAALLLAVAGPLLWTLAHSAGGWRTGFSSALWVTVAASMAIFAVSAVLSAQARRLAPLLLPYLLLLGLIATVWQHGESGGRLDATPGAWVLLHIALSVGTYAVLTLAAVAGLAVTLQERALKAKRPTALTRILPSIADGEGLQVRLLKIAAVVLGLGLVTGMAATWISAGVLMRLDHKTVLTLAAFAVICASLVAHRLSGVRGRRYARYVLLAYLLLTLGYPGVKFVTDVVLP